MRRRNGVVFDLDGTLVDSLLEIFEAVSATRMKWGLTPTTLESIKALVGRPPAEFFTDELPNDEITPAVRFFRERLMDFADAPAETFPGTVEVLVECQEQGLAMAIASNKSDHLVEVVAKRAGIRSFFASVAGTDGIESKPAPDVVLRAMHRAGINNGLMVGDTQADILAGSRAGLSTVGLMHGPGRGQGMGAANYRFSDMFGLLSALREGELEW